MLVSEGFMLHAVRREAPRRCAIALVRAAATFLIISFSVVSVRAQDDVRALWVVRTTLTSPAAIATMVKTAKASGFNTLIVQIRGRADAYYQGATEPRPASLANQPAFDPLGITIARAHEAGLRVHAWVNVNLVAGVNELPSARDHVIYRHPEWLMVPRVLGEDLAKVEPRSPEYLGRLARHARSQPADIEGLYLSPISAGAAEYTVGVVRDIVRRYEVDGVHLDYLRYPNEDFDYSREALSAFRTDVIADVTQADRRKYDARLAAAPLFYSQMFPERWRTFRVARLTSLLVQLKDAVKAVRPAAIVSVAVAPDATAAVTRRMQDWREWLARDLIDVLCPMAYTTDADLFASQISTARQIAGAHPLWAGIGAYRLSPDQIVAAVQSARRIGVAGIILFSYDSLSDPARGPDYLAAIGRAAFNSQY
jgi:uncharacterized lipoprotein YddW (UPF0748 family)